MKALSIFLIFIAFLSSCDNKGNNDRTKVADIKKVELNIEGMTCNGCEKTIEANVMKLEGVKAIKANHETGKANLEYDASNVDMEAIKKVVAKKGYTVKGITPREKVSKE